MLSVHDVIKQWLEEIFREASRRGIEVNAKVKYPLNGRPQHFIAAGSNGEIIVEGQDDLIFIHNFRRMEEPRCINVCYPSSKDKFADLIMRSLRSEKARADFERDCKARAWI